MSHLSPSVEELFALLKVNYIFWCIDPIKLYCMKYEKLLEASSSGSSSAFFPTPIEGRFSTVALRDSRNQFVPVLVVAFWISVLCHFVLVLHGET
ncbi:hypothetical protein AKJ16_DCAP00702 [Drosera capensis]